MHLTFDCALAQVFKLASVLGITATEYKTKCAAARKATTVSKKDVDMTLDGAKWLTFVEQVRITTSCVHLCT